MRDPEELRRQQRRKAARRRRWGRNASDAATVGVAGVGCLVILASVLLPLILMAAGAYWLFTH